MHTQTHVHTPTHSMQAVHIQLLTSQCTLSVQYVAAWKYWDNRGFTITM